MRKRFGAFILGVRVSRTVCEDLAFAEGNPKLFSWEGALRYGRSTQPAAYWLGEPEHSSVIPSVGVTQHTFPCHYPVQLVHAGQF